ncbi:hypothetical protein LP420_39470 [Massilia sp. B-10]|nr:hypothetical protein LP420_39470 [Massilia sp. B-10]
MHRGASAVCLSSAYADLLAAPVAAVVSCDTVAHPSNRISMAGAIA